MADFLKAESGIRQLFSRYTDAVWRKDLDAFADCFSEDCEWRIAGRVMLGRTAMVDHFAGVLARFRRIYFTPQPPILEVGEGTASGRTYLTERNTLADGRPFLAIGTYYDHLADHGDRWRFTWRLFQTHYAGPPDMTGEFIEQAEYGAPPAMPPRDAIPVGSTGAASAAAKTGG
jgi:ketosteroid isomerase-like protein